MRCRKKMRCSWRHETQKKMSLRRRGHRMRTKIHQIILPRRYRNQIIKLAHDIPLAGHYKQQKTGQKILRRFYWPTLFQDVRQHNQTCKECQLHGGRRRRATMIPLLVIGEPFWRISMEIVGPALQVMTRALMKKLNQSLYLCCQQLLYPSPRSCTTEKHHST